MTLSLRAPSAAPAIAPLSSYRAKQCPERLWKDLTYDPDLKVDDDPFVAALKQTGIDFERDIDTALRARADTVVIDPNRSLDEVEAAVERARSARIVVIGEPGATRRSQRLAAAATHAILEQPGRCAVLWNASLRPWRKNGRRYEWGPRSGKPDALVRNPATSKEVTWVPVDVKAHRVLAGTRKKAQTWSRSLLTDPYKSETFEASGPFRKSDAMQLAHYHRMLEFHGLAGDPIGGIVGTSDDQKPWIVWTTLGEPEWGRGASARSSLELYDEAFAQVRNVAEQAAAERPEPITWPAWKGECSGCPWREVCYEELSDVDDPTLLPGVTERRAAKLRDAGITSIRQLAKLDTATVAAVDAGIGRGSDDADDLIAMARNWPGSWNVSDVYDAAVSKAFRSAGLHTTGQVAQLDTSTARLGHVGFPVGPLVDQARVTDYARRRKRSYVFRRRGITTVEVPRAPVEIHVDMEEDGVIYLWGALRVQRNSNQIETTYHPFVDWNRDDDAEAGVFARFWAWLTAQIADATSIYGPDGIKVYHYTAAEDRCMRHIVGTHEHPELPDLSEVDRFLASETWVDLYPLLTKQLIWPTENHSLKALANYAGFMWRDDDPSGANSQLWFRAATDPDLPEVERLAARQRILAYNEDDVAATAALVNFVDRYRYTKQGDVPEIEQLDRRYVRT